MPTGPDIAVHLISMPICDTRAPSIQLGSLKAFLDGALAGSVPVHAHSAFFSILVLEPGSPEVDRQDLHLFDSPGSIGTHSLLHVGGKIRAVNRTMLGEAPYFVLYFRQYLRDRFPELGQDAADLLDIPEPGLRKYVAQVLTPGALDVLRARTERYLDTHVVPHLSRDGVNLIGFTLTFNQTFASLYALRYLQERCPDHRLVFVLGGSAIGMPTTQALLRRLEIDAWCVVGEGERKLLRLVEAMRGHDPQATKLESPVPGIVHVRDPIDYFSKQERLYEGQVEVLDVLPLPDYAEYFGELRARCRDDAQYAETATQIEVLLEGSRGCVFACTFCNLNHLWDGYRTQSADRIIENLLEIQRRHVVPGMKIRYVDNLCNWSSAVAKRAEERDLRIPVFMELRAKYGEEYWVRLVKRGVWQVQIGYEALSTELLAVMEKKTKTIDNVRALKFTSEVGLDQGSNLIFNYPGSTVPMVDETRRVLEHIIHMSALQPVHYALVEGSPIYERLSRAAKENLQPDTEVLFAGPLRTDYYAYVSFALPEEIQLEPEIRAAWAELALWYGTEYENKRPKFTIERIGELGDARRLVDTRGDSPVEYIVEGPAARVLDAAHRGLSFRELAEATGIAPQELQVIVDDLSRRRALLHVDDHYITVALRQRDELFAAYDAKLAERQRPARRPAALAVVT
jgi:radical SAM superfamily enzyme YgiQ (UPF0313 family)